MNVTQLKKMPALKAMLALAVASAFAVPAMAQEPISPIAYWRVEGGKLLDPYGKPFIFRGVTIDHGRAPDKTVQALKDISALGANSAQIEFPLVWTAPFTYPRPVVAQLIEIIKTCVETKLVCVLEPNDVAGFGVASGVASPANTASLWSSTDMQMALSAPGARNHIIIGFGNQHFGLGTEQFYRDTAQSYTSGILSSLPAGFLIMLDGSEWGQDTTKAMPYVAQQINQDSTLKHRVIYSIDFFSAYADPEKVRDYIATFAEIGAPLVVGGFAPAPYYHPFNPGPFPAVAPQLPAASVMQYAEQYGAGYFGWSWSGNQNPALDVASNWSPDNLTAWGNLLFNGTNGIKATAKRASIYGNTSSSSSSSSVSANQDPVAVMESRLVQRGCGTVYGELNGGNSTDPDGDPLTYEWTVSGDSKVYTSQNITYYMRGGVIYTFTLTVKDGKGGVGTTSRLLRHEVSDYCISSSSRTSSSARTSSSVPDKSSSSIYSSSSIRTSSSSSVRTSSSSSVAQTKAQCSYQIQSQWGNGFTAAIRIKNTTNTAINGWDVNWQYTDGSKVTNLWNATLTGSNPYNAKNLSWNSTIQPGQTIEFGFQGSKTSATASTPAVTGAICQ